MKSATTLASVAMFATVLQLSSEAVMTESMHAVGLVTSFDILAVPNKFI
jgi:hypothetical protein